VICRQGSVLVAAFHPELTEDRRLHRLFVDMTKEERR
jgi:pyridoxal 5'-phosphate synthase pdxT subunit